MLQHGFAQPLGIAFAGFRKLDYLLRDDIVGNVAAINKPKRYQCHLIGKTHEPHCLGVEFWLFRWDRIGMCISREHRRECYRTLSHRRLGKAAVGDI